MKRKLVRLVLTVLLWPALSGFALGQVDVIAALAPVVEAATLGQTENVHRSGPVLLSSQFSSADIEQIKAAGIVRVITLRKPGEVDWDERAAVESAGLEWINIPFADAGELSDEIFEKTRTLLREADQKPTLLHCKTANRVGGVWLGFRVLDQHVDWDTAVAEAKRIGLRNEDFLAKAQAYVSRNRQSAVSSEINRDFLDPNLDIDRWLSRFEIESREIFARRLEILKQCDLKERSAVADIGAGTGLFTRLFAHEVGPQGQVFAVEISPVFLQHINQQAKASDLNNITGVLCREDSVNLPAQSIDLAFVCDTYHHFAFPSDTLASIHRALRPDGLLVVVDFERIPGQSREWVLNHVRAGKETVRTEIEAAGFKFQDEPDVAGLEENYLLKFRRSN